MAYTCMKKLITISNIQLDNGSITQEEYDLEKKQYYKKLDVFLACNRLTATQYEELIGMIS